MTPRLHQAKKFVVQQITAGKFPVGELLPPAEVLAKKTECSAATVQSALMELQHEGIVRRVRRLGTVVARHPQTHRVCLFLAMDEHTNLLLQQQVYDALMAAGYQVDVVLASGQPEHSVTHCRQLRQGVDGAEYLVSISPDSGRGHFENVYSMFPHRVVYVLGGTRGYHDSHIVTPDQTHAAREVVEHLKKLGHRKVAVSAGGFPGEQSYAAEAAVACKHMLEISGIEFHPHYIFSQSIDELGPKFQKEKVTAYWALHDFQAHKVLQLCRGLGLRVPEDVSIIGRHDTPWCTQSSPELTSVSIDPAATAAAIVKAIKLCENEKQTVTRTLVAPKLIVRGSTGPARKR